MTHIPQIEAGTDADAPARPYRECARELADHALNMGMDAIICAEDVPGAAAANGWVMIHPDKVKGANVVYRRTPLYPPD